MWEGPWGDQFENSIRVEIDKLSKGVEKIVRTIARTASCPTSGRRAATSDQDTADTLDGIHRADSYHFKAQQARDNAFEEAAPAGSAPIACATTMPTRTISRATSSASIPA
jgi:hypothetical protein